jgi:hypothetical protein
MQLEQRVKATDATLRKTIESISGCSSVRIPYEDVKKLVKIALGIQEGRVLIGIYTDSSVTRVVQGEDLPSSDYVHLREAHIAYLRGEMEKARQPVVYGRPPRTMIRNAVERSFEAEEQLKNAQKTREERIMCTALASAYERGECFGEADVDDLKVAEAIVSPIPPAYQQKVIATRNRMNKLITAGNFRIARRITINDDGGNNVPFGSYRAKVDAKIVYVKV